MDPLVVCEGHEQQEVGLKDNTTHGRERWKN